MKKSLTLLAIGILFSLSIKAQKAESFLTSKYISGCPVEIEPIAKNSGLRILNYSNLETGIDSIKVVFGKWTQDEQEGYWITSYIKNVVTFQAGSLVENESSPNPTKIIDITYDNSSKKISVQLTDNTSKDEIQYVWIDNNNKQSKIASIIKIEKAIEKGKPFPSLTVKSLKGDSVSIKDYIGKYIVINWWATHCGPCIQEIPGLNSLVEKYKSNSDVVFLAIAFDEKEGLENFLNSKKFNYMQTLGDTETTKLFGDSYPKNIIVNPQGIITYYSEGGNEDKHIEIDNALKSLLTKKQSGI